MSSWSSICILSRGNVCHRPILFAFINRHLLPLYIERRDCAVIIYTFPTRLLHCCCVLLWAQQWQEERDGWGGQGGSGPVFIQTVIYNVLLTFARIQNYSEDGSRDDHFLLLTLAHRLWWAARSVSLSQWCTRTEAESKINRPTIPLIVFTNCQLFNDNNKRKCR